MKLGKYFGCKNKAQKEMKNKVIPWTKDRKKTTKEKNGGGKT